MRNQNVCFLIPKQKELETLRTVHFVLETSTAAIQEPKFLSMYYLYLITDGNGVLHLKNREIPLRAGDIFFGLPALAFAFTPLNDFKYIYVSYMGQRANYLIDKFKINAKNCVFHGFNSLIDLWASALKMPTDVAALCSESVLLYTFSVLASKYYSKETEPTIQSTAAAIKKYIDENFSSPQLSLRSISDALSYNSKYLSSLFKNSYKIGICDYIANIRIQYARTLMEQGISTIKNVAMLCGFTDALYFSKVFKAKTGVPPRKYLENLNQHTYDSIR